MWHPVYEMMVDRGLRLFEHQGLPEPFSTFCSRFSSILPLSVKPSSGFLSLGLKYSKGMPSLSLSFSAHIFRYLQEQWNTLSVAWHRTLTAIRILHWNLDICPTLSLFTSLLYLHDSIYILFIKIDNLWNNFYIEMGDSPCTTWFSYYYNWKFLSQIQWKLI